jgi:uncharacterized protein (TIGR03067 family)
MSMRKSVLVLVVLALGFAPAPLPRTGRQPPADDQTKLQGEWVVVEQQYAGKKMGQRGGQTTTLTIERDVWTFSTKGNVNSKWAVRLDPAASPRAVDLKNTDRMAEVAILGIYRLDGRKLTFAYEANGKRPTAFDTSDGSWLMLLERR